MRFKSKVGCAPTGDMGVAGGGDEMTSCLTLAKSCEVFPDKKASKCGCGRKKLKINKRFEYVPHDYYE
jgi:hypothetical protein